MSDFSVDIWHAIFIAEQEETEDVEPKPVENTPRSIQISITTGSGHSNSCASTNYL